MRVGVVGSCGSIGRRHVANLEQLGHEVLGYDPVSGRNDVRFERMIYDDCEAVVVATPTRFHEQALRACVERGRHVLIEKPISFAIGPLAQLLQAATDKGVEVMMGNNLRFHPCVQQTKIWLAQNKIGAPLWANFVCATESRDPGGDGIILNTGAHEVDIAQYFFGPGTCVSAYADDRAAVFTLLHEHEVRSAFHLDLRTPHRVREFWIAGEEQNLGVDLDSRRLVLGGVPTGAPGTYDDDYVNELRGFIDRINGRFAPGASGQDGLATLRTLLDVKRKAGIS